MINIVCIKSCIYNIVRYTQIHALFMNMDSIKNLESVSRTRIYICIYTVVVSNMLCQCYISLNLHHSSSLSLSPSYSLNIVILLDDDVFKVYCGYEYTAEQIYLKKKIICIKALPNIVLQQKSRDSNRLRKIYDVKLLRKSKYYKDIIHSTALIREQIHTCALEYMYIFIYI